MPDPVTRDQVIEEVNLVPDHHIPALLEVVRGFRAGCCKKDKKVGILRFAGSWAAFSDAEFQGFLDEITVRRAQAFSGRRRP